MVMPEGCKVSPVVQHRVMAKYPCPIGTGCVHYVYGTGSKGQLRTMNLDSGLQLPTMWNPILNPP